MKSKYIYIVLILVLATVLVFSTNENTDQGSDEEITQQKAPNDNIHNSLNKAPSKNNLREDFKRKLDSLRINAEANPTDTAGIKEYADILTMSHMAEKALVQYKKLRAISPKRCDVLLAMTYNYYNLKKYNEARKISEEILSYDKDRFEAQFNLGMISIQEGKVKEAKNIFNSIIEKYPDTKAAKLAKSTLEKLN